MEKVQSTLLTAAIVLLAVVGASLSRIYYSPSLDHNLSGQDKQSNKTPCREGHTGKTRCNINGNAIEGEFIKHNCWPNLEVSGIEPQCSCDRFWKVFDECHTDEICIDAQCVEAIAYEELLNNHRITNAIESNPYVDPTNYRRILLRKINDLETTNINSWNKFRHPLPFTDGEIQEVFLQKVAVSLYVEKHRRVPWSVLDYSDEGLETLLGDSYVNWSNVYGIMFNNNQYFPFLYGSELAVMYPEFEINTQKDLVDLVIMKMRDDGWVHRPAGYSYEQNCNLGEGSVVDFQCLEQVLKGTSTHTPLFIYSILQAYNVPSEQYLLGGNRPGISYPTFEMVQDGDAVYDSLLAGFFIRPNTIPVDNSYIPFSLLEQWEGLPPCEWQSNYTRKKTLDYLNLYDDSNWNLDVIATFCHIDPAHPNEGDYLFDRILNGNIPYFCQNKNPFWESYFPPPLSSEEVAEWRSNLSGSIECG